MSTMLVRRWRRHMAKQAKVDAMTLCCLVQPSGIVRRCRIHMAEQRCEVKMKAISLLCLVIVRR